MRHAIAVTDEALLDILLERTTLFQATTGRRSIASVVYDPEHRRTVVYVDSSLGRDIEQASVADLGTLDSRRWRHTAPVPSDGQERPEVA